MATSRNCIFARSMVGIEHENVNLNGGNIKCLMYIVSFSNPISEPIYRPKLWNLMKLKNRENDSAEWF